MRNLVAAESELEWYFTEGVLLFDTHGNDYDKIRVQRTPTGDPANDKRHRFAGKYLRVRRKLGQLPAWQQRVLELRYTVVGWSGDEFVNWWVPYSQWANLVRTLKVQGDSVGERKLRAMALVTDALKAYVGNKE